jgi:hypothetical protein
MNFERNFQFSLHYTQILALIIFILQATRKNSIFRNRISTIYKYHKYTSQKLK